MVRTPGRADSYRGKIAIWHSSSSTTTWICADHKKPTVPWYDLPQLYREQREEWQRMNGGYVFRNYFEILRAYAFRKKQDVVHPVLSA